MDYPAIIEELRAEAFHAHNGMMDALADRDAWIRRSWRGDMLTTIVLIACVAWYCETLVPEHHKEIAAVALVLTVLVALGLLAWMAIPPAGRL